jgi:Asp/Glu/hydantoin racemase
VPDDTPIATTEGLREFSRAILGNETELNITLAEQDNIDAALQLSRQPDVGAIILECTNMAPYAAAISTATGLPVFSAYHFICWFQSGLMPARFTGDIT